MVEFITLFLGSLVTGVAEVRLQVHPDVVALEVRLDSRAVATLREAPWDVEVDFGDELVPHLLEAVGFADGGREIGRASQWVNLAPKDADLTIALDRDPSTGGVRARISWQTVTEDDAPLQATATFDGEPVEVTDPSVVALPPHDPGRLHHLRVELEFGDAVRSAAEITFGGRYGDQVSSGLTAFPVVLETLEELPPVDAMQGWFRSGDRPVRVHAAEKGPAGIFVVRSPPAEQRLRDLARRRQFRRKYPILGEEHRLRFVGAGPAQLREGRHPFIVFPLSREITDRVSSLLGVLASVGFPGGPPSEVRLSDAVAVAGLFAQQSARRRAVVLITTSDSEDGSQFEPDRVRRYLETLGVPLVVWDPRVKAAKQPGRWGTALRVSNDGLLGQAYLELSRTLDRQRIVWLTGLHLPQSIELDSGVEGVRPVR